MDSEGVRNRGCKKWTFEVRKVWEGEGDCVGLKVEGVSK